MSTPKSGSAPGDDGSESQEQRSQDESGAGGEPEAGSFIVVGIGASAGGLEAFGELLKGIPTDIGMGFALVQHLDPHHPSVLTDLLRARTQLPVLEVTDGTVIRPNHVYVIPPNTTMTVERGALRLTPRAESAGRYMPVDSFFNSLAQDCKEGAIGIILSGAATDGTLGLKAIKAAGGITFAQDDSAKFDGMPRSAIAAGGVDFVLPPHAIAAELGAIARHPYRDSVAARLREDAPAFAKILRLLRSATGVDFSQYKPSTLLRRMERRIVMQKARSPEQYLEYLQQNPGELRALADDFLINVTEFFRDSAVFEALKAIAIPEILAKKEPGEAVRIWVPGCSTGEELYSIAMCVAECMEAAGADNPMHVFGSDLSERSIERARSATYDSGAVTVISEERLNRFFVQVEQGYQIVRSLRNKCVFAVHNLITDPPFSRMDLISCRNLLIYLGTALQDRVLNTLFYALQPKGYLILGHAERPVSLADHFVALKESPDIYVRKASAAKGRFELPARVAPFPVFRQEENPVISASKMADGGPLGPVQRQADRLLLAQYAPPALVIDDDYRIVEFRGEVGLYLAPDAGEADLDLFRMLRDDVALHLRAAVEEARQKNMGIRLERIRILRGRPEMINIAVTPVAAAGMGRHFLISFEDASQQGLPAGAPEPPADAEGKQERPGESGPGVAQLEAELASTRRYLQSIIEELRSANEEAQSSNEELQSSNEELQTAKEELQASNEELQTLNAEMDSRNADLRQLSDDLLNVLTSLHNPILLLDGKLRIRRFTEVSKKILNLIASDIGRPVSDLRPRINIPDLEEVVRRVVDSLVPYENEVRDADGRWYSLRVRPYRTSDNRIDGAVLQFIDVNELKRTLEQVRLARDYASAIVQTVREPLLVLDSELRIETANRAFYLLSGMSPEQSLKKPIFQVGDGQFDFPRLRELLEHVARYSCSVEAVEIERDFPKIGRRAMLMNARRIEEDHETGRILLALQDITEHKRAAEARYRRLFEAAKDGILIAEAESGEITDVNPFLEKLSGYGRQELVGLKISEIEPLTGTPDVESALERIRGQEMVHFPDVTLRSKSGRVVHVEIVANEYAEGAKKVVQFNIRDITERKRFERQLQHTQKLESLGLLAGGIAHDFNNLLTGILGNASLGLADAPQTRSARRYFREIFKASQRAADLTRQMLAYAGQGRFVVDRLDVSQLIREIEPLIQTSVPKMVAIQLEMAPGLPPVEADRSQIEQLVMNFIINGAEAIGEGKPGTVLVRTEARELTAEEIQREFPNDHLAPGTYVVIEVRDTGCGMDEATKAKIFDPFFTTKFTGRGLGLAAASGIVRSHKGAIRVYSSLGRGSSFEVFLPAAEARRPEEVPGAPASEMPATGTVLFVDDEETVRNLAKATLERSGWRVLIAENGAEGIRLFEEHQAEIDVVVLDMAMPLMGGEAAMQRIKAVRAGVPVVVSSGFNEAETMRRFAGQEVAGFLQKPYTAAQLMEAIAVVLGRI